MANGMYKLGVRRIMDGTIDLDTNTIVWGLTTVAYTANLDTDDFADDVGTIMGNGGLTTYGNHPTINNITLTSPIAGTFDTSDATDTITAVPGTVAYTQLIIWKQDTNLASSPLIAKYDVTVTSNGSDITVTWANDNNRIFRLVSDP